MNRGPGLLHQNFGNFQMFYRSTVQGYTSQVFWMNFSPSSAGYAWLSDHLAILGAFQKHLWALKSKSSYIFTCAENPHFFNVRVRFYCGISKVPFEIPHKICYPYIEECDFYTTLTFWELLDLRAHTRFWNAPWTSEFPITWWAGSSAIKCLQHNVAHHFYRVSQF